MCMTVLAVKLHMIVVLLLEVMHRERVTVMITQVVMGDFIII